MGKWIKWSFVLMIFMILLSAVAKSQQYGDPIDFLIGVLVSSLLFALCAGIEVSQSRMLSSSRKSLWIAGFILSGPIAGYFYVVHARKRIAVVEKRLGDVV